MPESEVSSDPRQSVKNKNNVGARLSNVIAAVARLDMFGPPLRSAKTPTKCRLKDCQRTTTHNGGYCSAYHCKLDRERIRQLP